MENLNNVFIIYDEEESKENILLKKKNKDIILNNIREKYNSDIDLSVIGDFDFLFCERLKEELSELETLLK